MKQRLSVLKGVYLSLVIMLLSAILMLLLGCSQATSAPASPPTSAPASTPAQTSVPASASTPANTPAQTAAPAANARTLRFSSQFPPVSPVSIVDKWMLDEITKRTNGAIIFTYFWSESLLKSADSITGCGKGVADVANAQGSTSVAQNPCWSTVELPGLGKQVWAIIWANYELIQNNPGIKAEFDTYNVVATRGYAPGDSMIISKKALNTLADMKGLRCKAAGATNPQLVQGLGMVPVNITWPETYDALDRGVLDAAYANMPLQSTYKFYEVSKYYTFPSFANNSHDTTIVFNKGIWTSLTKEQRDIITQISREWNDKYAQLLIEQNDGWIADAKKSGVQFVTFTKEQDDAFNKVSEQVRQDWFKKYPDKPLQEVWQQLSQLNSKYEKELQDKGYPWKRK
jgi:TRAP-type transport system periplasmic protein